MTTIKQYNAGTAQWETIVVGKQGPGVPTGGTAGQFLVKNSATDYDASWQSDHLWPTLSAGDWIGNPSRTFSGTAPAVGTLWYHPLLLLRTTTLDAIGHYQWNPNTVAGAVARYGIYGSNAWKKPGSLILDAGTIPFTSPGNTFYTLSINVTLTPGLYWLAMVPQGNAQNGSVGQGEAYGAWTRNSFGNSLNMTQQGIGLVYAITGITGALPATANYGSSVSSSPKVFVRVA